MVGGSLLLGSIRSMMGGTHHSFGDTAAIGDKATTQSPWSDQSGSGMARDAGINDINSSARADGNSRSGLLDTASKDHDQDEQQDAQDDQDDRDDMDLDSDDDGNSDYA
jgi:uncharacterized protein